MLEVSCRPPLRISQSLAIAEFYVKSFGIRPVFNFLDQPTSGEKLLEELQSRDRISTESSTPDSKELISFGAVIGGSIGGAVALFVIGVIVFIAKTKNSNRVTKY